MTTQQLEKIEAIRRAVVYADCFRINDAFLGAACLVRATEAVLEEDAVKIEFAYEHNGMEFKHELTQSELANASIDENGVIAILRSDQPNIEFVCYDAIPRIPNLEG